MSEQSKSLVKFQPYELDDILEDDEQAAGLTEGDFGKLKVGVNRLRILPGKPGCKPFVRVKEHYLKPLGSDKKVRFVCPRAHEHRACPSCSHGDELTGFGQTEEAKDFYPRFGSYCNAVNRANEAAGPKVYKLPKGVDESLRSYLLPEGKGGLGYGNFTHPVDGYDVLIKREGTGIQDTKYTVDAARDNTPLHEDAAVAAGWMEAAKDLRGYGHVPTDDELIESGVMGRRARRGAEEPEEKPRARRAAPSSSAADPPREARVPRGAAPRPRRAQDDAMKVEGDDEAPSVEAEPIDAEFEDEGFGS